MARSDWELLNPQQLFGLARLDHITHAMIWSMIANIGAYVAVVAVHRAKRGGTSPGEPVCRRIQALGRSGRGALLRGTPPPRKLFHLLTRFLGPASAEAAFQDTRAEGLRWPDDHLLADADFVHYVETQLAGAIGASSARHHGRLGGKGGGADDRRGAPARR